MTNMDTWLKRELVKGNDTQPPKVLPKKSTQTLRNPVYSGSPVHIAITILTLVDSPEQGSVNSDYRQNLRNAKSKALDILIKEMDTYVDPTTEKDS